jgi:hypothetical protein
MVEFLMVRAGKRHRQASFAAKSVPCNPLTQKEMNGTVYLNSVEFGCTVVKPWNHTYSPESEPATLASCLTPTL